MTFWELWKEVESKNPQIHTGEVKISSANFKKALKYAYEKGANHSTDTAGNFFDEFLKGMTK